MEKRIEDKITEIKIFSGIKLTPCDYFTGIQQSNGLDYFNVILPDRISESMDYNKLLNMASKFNIISKVSPNGVNRLAIYF